MVHGDYFRGKKGPLPYVADHIVCTLKGVVMQGWLDEPPPSSSDYAR